MGRNNWRERFAEVLAFWAQHKRLPFQGGDPYERRLYWWLLNHVQKGKSYVPEIDAWFRRRQLVQWRYRRYLKLVHNVKFRASHTPRQYPHGDAWRKVHNCEANDEGRSHTPERWSNLAGPIVQDLAHTHEPLQDIQDQAETWPELEDVFELVLSMAKLSERQKQVLRSRFVEDRTLQDIADEYGVSRERIRQIEEIALTRLSKNGGVKGVARSYGESIPESTPLPKKPLPPPRQKLQPLPPEEIARFHELFKPITEQQLLQCEVSVLQDLY